MSYCTSCLDGPFDQRHVVMQWGTRGFESRVHMPWTESRGGNVGDGTSTAMDAAEALPIVVSGGGSNPEALQGRPAILDVPIGAGHVLVFNFNPLHRDMNRADHRYLFNGILNWKHIVNRR